MSHCFLLGDLIAALNAAQSYYRSFTFLNFVLDDHRGDNFTRAVCFEKAKIIRYFAN